MAIILDLRNEEEWSYQDLIDLGVAVVNEQRRRNHVQNIDTLVAESIRDYQETQGREEGDEWIQPTGYIDAYPIGSMVTHNGKTWVATQNLTAGEPGVAGWREYQAPGQIVDWVAPHAGEEYPVGAVVRYEDHLWRNDLDRPNGWQPGQPGAGWTDLGPESDYDD